MVHACPSCWSTKTKCTAPRIIPEAQPTSLIQNDHKKRLLPQNILRSASHAGALISAILAAEIVRRYDPSHNQRPTLASHDQRLEQNTPTLLETTVRNTCTFCERQNQLLRSGKAKTFLQGLKTLPHHPHLHDPPPLLFLAACVSFAFSIAILLHLQNNERHRNRFMMVGILAGGVVGCWQGGDVIEGMKGYLAFSTLLALAASFVVHPFLGSNEEHQVDYESRDMKELSGQLG